MSKVMGTIYKVGREKENERAIEMLREREIEREMFFHSSNIRTDIGLLI